MDFWLVGLHERQVVGYLGFVRRGDGDGAVLPGPKISKLHKI